MNNNKNLNEADISAIGALFPVAAVGLAAGGYLAAKGIGSFKNFLASRAKRKADATAAAAPAPIAPPTPVPIDDTEETARKSAKRAAKTEKKAARREREQAEAGESKKTFQGILSTYGDIGRAVGASKAAAATAAAARQAALDKAHTERQSAKDTADAARADKALEYTKNKDERLAQIAAAAAAKAGERQSTKDAADAARADKALEYGKNKEEREALRIANDTATQATRADKQFEYQKKKDESDALRETQRIASLAAQAESNTKLAEVGANKNKILRFDTTTRAWQTRRLTNAKIAKLNADTATKSSLFSKSATTPATPAGSKEPPSTSPKLTPMADAGTTMADMLKGKSTAPESKPEEVPAAATPTAPTPTAEVPAKGASRGKAKRKPAEVLAAATPTSATPTSATPTGAGAGRGKARSTTPSSTSTASTASTASTTSTGTGRGRARRTTPTPPAVGAAAEVSATPTVSTESSPVPPLGKAIKSSNLFPFTSSPTIGVSKQKSGVVPTKTVLTNLIPVNTSEKQEPDGLTREQLKRKEEIKQEGLRAKAKDNSSVNELTNSTHYYVTSILKNLLG